MSERIITFREITTYSIGGGWGLDEPQADTVNVAVIRGTDIPKVTFGDISNVPIRHETRTKAEKRFLKPGDLVLEIAGGSPTSGQSTGRSILITEKILSTFDLPVIPASFCKLMRVDIEKASPLYAFYALQNMYKSGRAYDYEQQSTGISNFQFEYFQDTETIRLPPLPEQRAITDILSAFDDKIELNHRMNRTLESIARAVFRLWFVDEEEVKKWKELTWGEIATLEYGKSLSNYKDSDAPYIVYGTNGPIGRHTEALYSSEGIIIGRKGAYRGIHYSPNPFFVIDTAFYLKPQKPFSMKWAYYELLRFDLNSMDSGSAIPSTSRADFYNIPVMFPPQKIMNAFEDFVAPLFSKIYSNENESRILASLRDSLLPKLMKGEVKVKE